MIFKDSMKTQYKKFHRISVELIDIISDQIIIYQLHLLILE